MARTIGLDKNPNVVSFTVEKTGTMNKYHIVLVDGLYQTIKFVDKNHPSDPLDEKLATLKEYKNVVRNKSSETYNIKEVSQHFSTIQNAHNFINKLVNLNDFEQSRKIVIQKIQSCIDDIQNKINEENLKRKKNAEFRLIEWKTVILKNTSDNILYNNNNVIRPLSKNKVGDIVNITKSIQEWKTEEHERLSNILKGIQEQITILDSINTLEAQEWLETIIQDSNDYLNDNSRLPE